MNDFAESQEERRPFKIFRSLDTPASCFWASKSMLFGMAIVPASLEHESVVTGRAYKVESNQDANLTAAIDIDIAIYQVFGLSIELSNR